MTTDLTPEEATLIGILLVSDAPLHEVALDCGLSLLDALRILDRPHCQAHMNAARDAARRRFDAKVADAATQSLQTLRDIAAAPHPDPATIERRRAATTIIRAATAHHRRPVRRRPHRRPTHPEAQQPRRRPEPPNTPAREDVNPADLALPSTGHRTAVPHEYPNCNLHTEVHKPP